MDTLPPTNLVPVNFLMQKNNCNSQRSRDRRKDSECINLIALNLLFLGGGKTHCNFYYLRPCYFRRRRVRIFSLCWYQMFGIFVEFIFLQKYSIFISVEILQKILCKAGKGPGSKQNAAIFLTNKSPGAERQVVVLKIGHLVYMKITLNKSFFHSYFRSGIL